MSKDLVPEDSPLIEKSKEVDKLLGTIDRVERVQERSFFSILLIAGVLPLGMALYSLYRGNLVGFLQGSAMAALVYGVARFSAYSSQKAIGKLERKIRKLSKPDQGSGPQTP